MKDSKKDIVEVHVKRWGCVRCMDISMSSQPTFASVTAPNDNHQSIVERVGGGVINERDDSDTNERDLGRNAAAGSGTTEKGEI